MSGRFIEIAAKALQACPTEIVGQEQNDVGLFGQLAGERGSLRKR